MECLYCHQKISRFWLFGKASKFCNKAHEEAYRKETLDRLTFGEDEDTEAGEPAPLPLGAPRPQASEPDFDALIAERTSEHLSSPPALDIPSALDAQESAALFSEDPDPSATIRMPPVGEAHDEAEGLDPVPGPAPTFGEQPSKDALGALRTLQESLGYEESTPSPPSPVDDESPGDTAALFDELQKMAMEAEEDEPVSEPEGLLGAHPANEDEAALAALPESAAEPLGGPEFSAQHEALERLLRSVDEPEQTQKAPGQAEVPAQAEQGDFGDLALSLFTTGAGSEDEQAEAPPPDMEAQDPEPPAAEEPPAADRSDALDAILGKAESPPLPVAPASDDRYSFDMSDDLVELASREIASGKGEKIVTFPGPESSPESSLGSSPESSMAGRQDEPEQEPAAEAPAAGEDEAAVSLMDLEPCAEFAPLELLGSEGPGRYGDVASLAGLAAPEGPGGRMSESVELHLDPVMPVGLADEFAGRSQELREWSFADELIKHDPEMQDLPATVAEGVRLNTDLWPVA